MAECVTSAAEKAWAAFDQRTLDFEIKNAILFREGREPLTIHRDEDCLRNGYSATKSFTAALFAAAAQKGLVSPDERIVDCFPEELPEEVSPELSHLTFRHLLSMTVGRGSLWHRNLFTNRAPCSSTPMLDRIWPVSMWREGPEKILPRSCMNRSGNRWDTGFRHGKWIRWETISAQAV